MLKMQDRILQDAVNEELFTMSVLLIVVPLCTLVASLAASW